MHLSVPALTILLSSVLAAPRQHSAKWRLEESGIHNGRNFSFPYSEHIHTLFNTQSDVSTEEVFDLGSECPEGMRWNPFFGCLPIKGSSAGEASRSMCPPGWHWTPPAGCFPDRSSIEEDLVRGSSKGCPPGWQWNPFMGGCFPNGRSSIAKIHDPICPDGWVWKPILDECLPALSTSHAHAYQDPGCPDGWAWNPILDECLPTRSRAYALDCPKGYIWDTLFKECADYALVASEMNRNRDVGCPPGESWDPWVGGCRP
ncbi:hypothetical protein ONS96_008432 [Cadophora gregata f. sp. sojae]|nr:hypothetical protein ONS96_008432 [Cadophora gregata f. sp. sojae]